MYTRIICPWQNDRSAFKIHALFFLRTTFEKYETIVCGYGMKQLILWLVKNDRPLPRRHLIKYQRVWVLIECEILDGQ